MGKGSKRRPTDEESYQSNYDRIFGGRRDEYSSTTDSDRGLRLKLQSWNFRRKLARYERRYERSKAKHPKSHPPAILYSRKAQLANQLHSSKLQRSSRSE
jgi:hypothetical protein